MKRTIAILALMMTASSLRAPAQATGTLRAQLIGTWKFVAARQRMDDGTWRPEPAPGPRGAGYIMYDATGHMCVVVANPDRLRWAAPAAPTEAELRSAMQGLVAYCGTYATNEKERSIVHHVEVDREPPAMGTDRKRLITITGDRMVLRPQPLPPGVKEWTVEWVRVR